MKKNKKMPFLLLTQKKYKCYNTLEQGRSKEMMSFFSALFYFYCEVEKMGYSKEDVINYVSAEDVKFIRLLFLDAYGKQKNIAIMPNELEAVFNFGYTINSNSVLGSLCGKVVLWPDPNTISVLPWRPSTGKVIKMLCDIKNLDGTDFDLSGRQILKKAIEYADSKGASIFLRTEFEFYLFKLDTEGDVTNIP